jgi:hypothetical protein
MLTHAELEKGEGTNHAHDLLLRLFPALHTSAYVCICPETHTLRQKVEESHFPLFFDMSALFVSYISFIFFSVCLSVCLSVSPSVTLSLSLSHAVPSSHFFLPVRNCAGFEISENAQPKSPSN